MTVTRALGTNKMVSENIILVFCGCGEVQTSVAAFRHGIRSGFDQELE
jgi:hypothetical protein